MLHQKINKGGVIFAQKGTLQIVAVQQNHGQRLKNIVKNLAVVGVEAQHDYKADGRVIPADGGTADIYSHTGTRTKRKSAPFRQRFAARTIFTKSKKENVNDEPYH